MRRNMMLGSGLAAVLLVLTGCRSETVVPTPNASPADTGVAGQVVLRYAMDETTGTVMKDSGGTGLDGRIGKDIIIDTTFAGATGYQFPSVDPNTTTEVQPGHLATIPDSPSVDPGDQKYSVEIRYRTDEANGANLIQKGQAHTPGGQFKIQVPEGNPQCYYKGSAGKVGATSQRKLDDGAWHVLLCTRTSTGVSLYVDGVLAKEHTGRTGTIDNTFDMTIGGKSNCDMVKVECDYFGGTIDYVEITKG